MNSHIFVYYCLYLEGLVEHFHFLFKDGGLAQSQENFGQHCYKTLPWLSPEVNSMEENAGSCLYPYLIISHAQHFPWFSETAHANSPASSKNLYACEILLRHSNVRTWLWVPNQSQPIERSPEKWHSVLIIYSRKFIRSTNNYLICIS